MWVPVGIAGLGHRSFLPLVFVLGPGALQSRNLVMRICARLRAIGAAVLLCACATAFDNTAAQTAGAIEDIYVLRSIRNSLIPPMAGALPRKTRIRAFPKRRRALFLVLERGRSARGWKSQRNESRSRCRGLRACFGATDERPRQNFYAELKLGSISFHGKGECLAVQTDFPEPGLFPVRCQLIYSPVAGSVCGRVSDDQYADEQSCFWRRHGSGRIYSGLDRHHSPLEIQVGRGGAILAAQDVRPRSA